MKRSNQSGSILQEGKVNVTVFPIKTCHYTYTNILGFTYQIILRRSVPSFLSHLHLATKIAIRHTSTTYRATGELG